MKKMIEPLTIEDIKAASTVSIKPIKSCPYLLPCGFCDKTGILCSQYESNLTFIDYKEIGEI